MFRGLIPGWTIVTLLFYSRVYLCLVPYANSDGVPPPTRRTGGEGGGREGGEVLPIICTTRYVGSSARFIYLRTRRRKTTTNDGGRARGGRAGRGEGGREARKYAARMNNNRRDKFQMDCGINILTCYNDDCSPAPPLASCDTATNAAS